MILDDVSILQTEHGNASDITINYSSDLHHDCDVSNVGTIIYYQNLHNDGDNQANPSWKKTRQHSTIINSKPPTWSCYYIAWRGYELDFFFMMMNSVIFHHIADETNYVCRGENQKKT